MAHAIPPSPDELRQLICQLLDGTAGKGEAHWASLIGDITPVQMTFSPTSNWALSPSRAKGDDRVAIRKAVEAVRKAHPYVGWER